MRDVHEPSPAVRPATGHVGSVRGPAIQRFLVGAATLIPTLVVLNTLLAMAGLFGRVSVVVFAVVPATLLSVWVASRVPTLIVRLPPIGPTALVGVTVIVVAVVNIRYSGEHLLTYRDPGVYLSVARWLTSNGGLLFDGVSDAMAGIDGVTANWTGFYEVRADGQLYSQFLHGYPALIAPLAWVFGTGALFHANAVIAAAAGVTTFLLVAQFTRAWTAAAATTITAVGVVTFYFARTTYSEPLFLLLAAVGALFLLLAHRTASPMLLAVAGAAVGATSLVRIDGWVIVGTFLVAASLVVVRSTAAGMRSVRAALLVFLPLPIAGIGLFDGVAFAGRYLPDRLQLVATMGLFVVLCTFGALFLLRLGLSGGGEFAAVERFAAMHDRSLRTFGTIGTLLIAVGLLLVRPVVAVSRYTGDSDTIARMLEAEGSTADASRNFAELSLRWFTWYWGWVGVAVVVAGLLVAIWSRRSGSWGIWVPLVVLGPQLLLYLVRPSITPDHPWTMRRFYATALVLVPLLVAVAVDRLISDARRRRGLVRVAYAVGGAALAVSLVVPVVTTASPLIGHGQLSGMRAAVDRTCAALPDGAHVLVEGPIGVDLGAAVMTFCDVPVAHAPRAATTDELEEARGRAETGGGTLVVLSTEGRSPQGWSIIDRQSLVVPVANQTLLKPSDGTTTLEIGWTVSTPS